MKNKKDILLIICALVLTFVFIKIDEVVATKNIDNYDYYIGYYDDFIPGAFYDIYILKDRSITVIQQQYCSTSECINGKKKIAPVIYNVKILNNNKNKLANFIDNNFTENDREIYNEELSSGQHVFTDNEMSIIKAIIYNNDEYFEYYYLEKK